jgi:hypothetical protein
VARQRLYVLNRLEGSLSVIDLETKREQERLPLGFDPTPEEILAGRPFLYDASRTSGHGDMACASCHVFGDFDQLAWDLGDPEGEMAAMPFELSHEDFQLKPAAFHFHPMKGPMTTQSFRGLSGAGPMHWRGDRHGPEGSAADELESFRSFRAAFETLNGLAEQIAPEEMDAMGRFVLTLRYPPNPHQALDRQPRPAEQAGAELFSGDFPIDSGVTNCAGCHNLPLGTNGRINFDGERAGQDLKAPHLRNIYQKLGRADSAGPQQSGFGLGHDGAVDSIESFLVGAGVFDFPGEDEASRQLAIHQLTAFVLAFDTGMAPAVGWQASLGSDLSDRARQELVLVKTRAQVGDCDLLALTATDGGQRGWLLDRQRGVFEPDLKDAQALDIDALLALGRGGDGPVTFVCVPPGDGRRSALDRDRDGHANGDERRAGSDPADPRSLPGDPSATPPPSPTPSPEPTAGVAGSILLPRLDRP